MVRKMCKSKIHRVTVTQADLEYEGSVAVDTDLMKAADVLPFEMVQIFDINHGQRFETYAIPAEAGSGTVCVNGAAARLVQTGDLLIILSQAMVEDKEARNLRPRIVFVDSKNKIVQTKVSVAAGEKASP
jgi:aspartate 1-decarboxylase